MERVFKIGDIVYHLVEGQGTVVQEDGSAVCVNYLNGRSNWCLYEYLSFKPWPKPVHIRPFKTGWYVFKNPRGQVGCRAFFDAPPTSYKMLVYLGEHLPEEMK